MVFPAPAPVPTPAPRRRSPMLLGALGTVGLVAGGAVLGYEVVGTTTVTGQASPAVSRPASSGVLRGPFGSGSSGS